MASMARVAVALHQVAWRVSYAHTCDEGCLVLTQTGLRLHLLESCMAYWLQMAESHATPSQVDTEPPTTCCRGLANSWSPSPAPTTAASTQGSTVRRQSMWPLQTGCALAGLAQSAFAASDAPPSSPLRGCSCRQAPALLASA